MEDVIFSGTRDRNPTGMAEVSLTLIDPEVYGGPDTNAPTEIEIQDELPSAGMNCEENWDEAEIRAQAAAETERAVEEAQPGRTEEVDGEVTTVAPAPAEATTAEAPANDARRDSAGAAGGFENPAPQIQSAAYTTPERFRLRAGCSAAATANTC